VSRGGKKNFVTFIVDSSRYTKVHLIKHDDEAFYEFLTYKANIENQLSRKSTRLDQIEVVNMYYLMTIVLKKALFMK